MDPGGHRAALLLSQASRLADTLSFAFDTSSHIPQNNLAVQPKPRRKKTKLNDITAAGDLTLEWSHLSALTNSSIGRPAQLSLERILSETGEAANPFPGLSGRFLDVKTGKLADREGGWYGGAGGFYEYLLKLYVHSPNQFSHCRDRWILVADSSMKYLASHPSTRPDLTFLASYNGTEILYQTDHTAHFAAANFILGGSVLGEQKYIDFGLRLVESQVEMYRSTATGIGPDTFAWLPDHCSVKQPRLKHDHNTDQHKMMQSGCRIPSTYVNQTSFYKKAGYWNTSPIYMLRPEVLESLYYAYRITRNSKYQDASWEIFQRILQHTQIESGGFAELVDVNQIPDKISAMEAEGKDSRAGMVDRQYSFMLAEVVKYAWLIHVDDFDDDGNQRPWHVQSDGRNQWVFNTEAHPLRLSNENESLRSPRNMHS